ncbi:dihydrodipicolinate synthase family protein [Streptomyces sp. WAC06614]|uniref:dihydrodipicolinate synthase family protein n=1 Tax=Streptomyces sp. WAC06614 TaxID=2487416 RepID=UPI000F77D499|nr:dihydrodipicolinate synthase family protein [Streptomyces sp. WAC06614]RSS83286.1 4-hydroxy-tetrahydrodipicolinate synthase [Streptomyces sp. WAC06614]
MAQDTAPAPTASVPPADAHVGVGVGVDAAGAGAAGASAWPLSGIHVPLVTPFAASGEPAVEALEGLAHEVLDAGAAGVVALGTTAEAAALDPAERERVTDVCARVCAERGAVLTVGAGSSDTRSSEAALGALARWPQVRAALVTVPAFVRPSAAGVLAHFARLAEVSPVPLVVYHIPYRTGLTLDAATLRALGELPGVAGVKYAAGGIDQETVALLGALPPGFAVLAGDDVHLSAMLALGATGGILASAHLATARFVELATAWRAGDVARARPLGHALARLSAAAFAEPNPVVVKAVLHAQGRIPTPDVRLPLLPAAGASVEAALRALEAVGGTTATAGAAETSHHMSVLA